ncbi:nicotinamide riboside transporter PnuC [Nonlabens ulvanivorans]|uniref:Nicotinamide riboside transporter PnuC n=3 Tax=Nonlabens ulvanivorans TaxID=906888 RepID=A0A084JUH1_NONUL|nr:nicotinamide riboside transporter PnuC [Nonlabens ulvanivorans]KEZ92605.1 nicotinamide mononucleotide transporter [Nonlabens ulvanivorans]PRX15445.1 nicotinamide mononucleotide transporter [Nonlabens ulvanivorans]GAK74564.1 ribosyl nicotinamide transporter [Nonlabens ulvanivorans]GAK98430.1 ribosyl nicotinamide transporter [Nonlabens ulvanivorans]GAL73737.1 ribosyl nicotinamide transporter Pnuc-like [Nonlabens ulvanivorans]
MSEVIEFLFGQYRDYKVSHILLEVVAIIASIISVIYSFKNKIWVFPFGILSTLIFVYLLLQWNLLGDMLINAYYFIMSVYGWYIWTRKVDATHETPITITSDKEWIHSFLLLLSTAVGVYVLYFVTNRLESIVSYIDMLTTGIFFAGMWLMARRKLEHWLVLMVGNVISVPLYFYKGYSFSALLYLFLAIIAYYGYLEWKKYLNKQPILGKE